MGTTALDAAKRPASKGNGKMAQRAQKGRQTADANIYAQRVEKKAYELYEKGGCQNGHDWEDWFEAEKIVEADMIAGR